MENEYQSETQGEIWDTVHLHHVQNQILSEYNYRHGTTIQRADIELMGGNRKSYLAEMTALTPPGYDGDRGTGIFNRIRIREDLSRPDRIRELIRRLAQYIPHIRYNTTDENIVLVIQTELIQIANKLDIDYNEKLPRIYGFKYDHSANDGYYPICKVLGAHEYLLWDDEVELETPLIEEHPIYGFLIHVHPDIKEWTTEDVKTLL